MFENQLLDKQKKINDLKKKLFGLGSGCLIIGTGMYFTIGLSNKDFVPETMVCFKPENVNNPENFKCDRESRVKLILSGLDEYWSKKDVFWTTKIAQGRMKKFDSNLDNSMNFLSLTSVLGLISCGCFGYRLYLTTEHKNLNYNLKRIEIFNNDTLAQAAIRLEVEKAANIFRHEPSSIEQKLMFRELEMKVAEYEEKIALSQLNKTKHLFERENILEDNNPKFSMVAAEVDLPEIKGISWFDWKLFRKGNHSDIPHIRVIGATGTGKTVLISYLMQNYLPGNQYVISPKADPNKNLFGNLPVKGIPEDWEMIESIIAEVVNIRSDRNKIIFEGTEDDYHKMESLTYFFDESKDTRDGMGTLFAKRYRDEMEAKGEELVLTKLKAAKKLGIEFYEESVRSMLRQARAAKIRLILSAVDDNIGLWGLAGEGKLVDSFVNIYLGKKAHDQFEIYISKKSFLSPEERVEAYNHLVSYGHRAMFVQCGLGEFCGVVPEIKFQKNKLMTVEK